MRIDLISIFPDYFAALELSLPGKAVSSGLLEIHRHDLRDWTTDRHRTVDDAPYGGGPGMVMRPEPWTAALEDLVPAGQECVLIVPSPAGERFSQTIARELAASPHLVFACGRYEGIDQRVLDQAAAKMPVREISLGDFVLNGGEVAALAILEAVVRLLPGFMGNAESLVEESHENGLLEAPVYTRPPQWRGDAVPPVLLSGDHDAIRSWRSAQSRLRTARRRPDLLAPSSLLPDAGGAFEPGELRSATRADAGELWTLQRACWLSEQEANPGVVIPALQETLADVEDWITEPTVLVLRRGGRLIGAVRGRRHAAEASVTWDIGRLMVAPDLEGHGLGRRLLAAIEAAAPPDTTDFALITGANSLRNQRMYRRAGFRLRGEIEPGAVRLTKRRHR